MKNSFLVLCVFSLLLVLAVAAYYLFSKINATPLDRENTMQTSDALRIHGVTDLASKVSFVAKDKEIAWPQEWKQIGTSTSECQFSTSHCQVTSEECFDLQKHSADKFILPVDPSRGSPEKTGYAIRQSNHKVEIIACFGEGTDAITQQIRL